MSVGALEWVEVRVTDDGSGMAPRDDSPGRVLGLPLIGYLTDQFEHRGPRRHGTVEALPAFPVGRARPDPPAADLGRPER